MSGTTSSRPAAEPTPHANEPMPLSASSKPPHCSGPSGVPAPTCATPAAPHLARAPTPTQTSPPTGGVGSRRKPSDQPHVRSPVTASPQTRER